MSSQSLPAAPGCCTTAYADSGASVGSLAVFARCAGLLYALVIFKTEKAVLRFPVGPGERTRQRPFAASVCRPPPGLPHPGPTRAPSPRSGAAPAPGIRLPRQTPVGRPQLFPIGARRLGRPQLFPIGARLAPTFPDRGSAGLAARGSRLAAGGWRAHPPASVCRVSL
jgi:hypothetical protein